MNAAMVIRPTAVTAEMRTPAIITGRAWGICTLYRIWNRDMPMPWAASTISGLMPWIPAKVFLMMGSRE